MKFMLSVVILGAALLLTSGVKADEFLYSYQSADFDWTAELPMAPDMPAPVAGQFVPMLDITSFLTFSINPTSFYASLGCTSVTEADFFTAFNPISQNLIETKFDNSSGQSCGDDNVSTSSAVMGTGTFVFTSGNIVSPVVTLTVTDLTTAPEPSSLLLLCSGLLPLAWIFKTRLQRALKPS